MRQTALVFGVGLAALAISVGQAAADSSQYPSPLYLSGAASSVVSGSDQLVASKGLSADATTSPTCSLTTVVGSAVALPWGVSSPQVAVTGTTGTGSLGAGGAESYVYCYTLVDAGGETVPSIASNTVSANQQNITVSGLPTGVTVRLYRQSANSAYKLVAELPNNSSSTYLDSVPDASLGAILPQAQNRTNYSGAGSAIGWYDYSPGVPLTTPNVTNGNMNPSTPGAAAAFSGKGWVVDGGGNVAFATGPWQFTTKITTKGTFGTAHLVVGMWKVDGTGNMVGSPLIDPTCSSTPCGENSSVNIALASATGNAVVSSFTVPAFSLSSGQHLYVQFYRHQTAAALSGNTITTLNAYDGVAAISHPTAWTLPTTPALVTPAAAGYTNGALTATFSAPDAGDTGTIIFDICSDAACSTIVTSGTSASVANGANASWTPTGLADGAYYWRAMATDAAGGTSSWSATRSVTFDTVAPDTRIGTGPASATNSTSATFTFSATESGSTFQCRLDGGSWTTCVSPQSYNGLSNASHTFDVEATDQAGNTDSTPASSTWTVDATSPVTTITTSPPNVTNSSSASFGFSASKPGSTFQCAVDGATYAACTTPSSSSGLAAGTHTFQVRATDTLGNVGTASYSWTVDKTPPETTITSASGNSFAFASSKTGSTFQCSLDGSAFTACTSPTGYSGLADGSHTFKVEATDPAGNTDATPASSTWTIDTTPPETTIGSGPQTLTSATSASFAFSSSESGSTFQCSLDGAAFTACSSPASFSGLADTGHTFEVKATDAAGNTDPTPASAGWTVDTTPPSAPGALTGSTTADGLALSWPSADGAPVEYVLYVNGIPTTTIDAATTTTTITNFVDGDTRTFAVSAVDAAGNEGPQSVTVTTVPDFVGLSASAADATIAFRKFQSRKQTLGTTDGSVVVSQSPAAGTIVPVQSLVVLTLGAAPVAVLPPGKPSGFVVNGAGGRTTTCVQSSRVAVHIKLDRKADLDVRFLTAAGRPVGSMKLRKVHAGSRTLTLHLPFALTKGKRYRMVLTANLGGRLVRDEIELTVAPDDARTAASAFRCG